MGVENWQARWHAPQKPQEKRGFSRPIVRATSPKKWHALARSLPQRREPSCRWGGEAVALLRTPRFGEAERKRGVHGMVRSAVGPASALGRRRTKQFVPAS